METIPSDGFTSQNDTDCIRSVITDQAIVNDGAGQSADFQPSQSGALASCVHSDNAMQSLEEQARTHVLGGRLHDAELIYANLIKHDSENPVVYTNMAIIYRRTGRLTQAMELLLHAKKLTPAIPEVDFALGNLLMETGDVESAITAYQQAISIKADFPQAMFNLANAYLQKGNTEGAISFYNKALCLNENFPEACFNLGNALRQQGLISAAINAYHRGIKIQPNNADALFNLGIALYEQASLSKAIACFKKALAIRPDFPEALFKLGNAQRESGDVHAAVSSYQSALSLTPLVPEAHFNLGIFYRDVGDLDAAIKSFDKAVSLRDDYGEAHRNYALALLLAGRYREGWERYEWRREEQVNSKFYQCTSYWIPAPGADTVLIVGEQGVGDQIMFCSMIKDVQKYTSKTMLQIDQRLLPLIRRSMANVEVFDTKQLISETQFDACIPMGSLGRHFRRSRQDFHSARTAYLVADTNRSADIRRQISADGDILCGISWDSMRKDTGPKKSIPLDCLATSVARKGIKLVSLQYGDSKEQLVALKDSTGIEVATVDSIDNFYDLDGLASLIDACDLVITISNTTVHLAGALGKNTWLLLQKIPDWRWGIDGDECLWYPSTRLIRQNEMGNWIEVMQRVRGLLDTFVAQWNK
jgi:tetratricopeptide (TPR) repeat protein